MPVLIVLGILIVLYLAFSAISLARISMPLEPALTPGEVAEARDPEFFALQEQSFAESGYRAAGDFCWHEGLNTTVMRVFREISGESYGWAMEESIAGMQGARRSVSVLTEFADGTLLDTTSRGPTALAIAPWFLRESVPLDTPSLLRRHRERKEQAVREGKQIAAVPADRLLATIRRNERRLGEYQVETGRMRLVGDRLRFSPRSVARLMFRSLFQMVAKPFRARKAER